LERGRSRSKSPEKAVEGRRPISRSPSPPTENRESKEQPARSSFPARRFDQTRVRIPWTPPPVRSFRGVGTTNQNPTQNQNIPRGRGQGCWTRGKLGCHSLLHRRNDRQNEVSPPRQARIQPLIRHVPNTSPLGKAVVMCVVDSGATSSSTMMMGLKRMGKIEVFPLSLQLPLRLSDVDRSRETTSGTRVRAPGLRRIRSARSLTRSSS